MDTTVSGVCSAGDLTLLFMHTRQAPYQPSYRTADFVLQQQFGSGGSQRPVCRRFGYQPMAFLGEAETSGRCG